MIPYRRKIKNKTVKMVWTCVYSRGEGKNGRD